jgi:hypothetical protein
MKDLLHRYYASVRVVRIPQKNRYMLIEKQVGKLYHEIERSCQLSHSKKQNTWMLSNSDDLGVYLPLAFDHFSRDLDTPFNFIEVAVKNSPIPSNFAGNIVKLAVAVKDYGNLENGPKIFEELSIMVASTIVLDCVRFKRPGKQSYN